MSLTIPRSYSANNILTKTQLDAALDSIETKFNTTLIAGSEIQDGAIDAAEIAANAVTTVKINDLAVNTAKLAANAVTTAKITDANVTTAKIADANITTAKIADANVTRAKLVAVGQQISSSSGSFTSTSSTFVDVTNLSVSVTTTGRPVMIMLAADNAGSLNRISGSDSSGSAIGVDLQLLRDSTVLSVVNLGGQPTAIASCRIQYPPSCFSFLDTPAAGTYAYKVQVKRVNTTSIEVTNVKLVAFEL